MRVAILGATGFVGAPILAEALTRPDLAVTAIVRRSGAIAPTDRVTEIVADVFDPDALREAVRGHDAVIHAWHPGRTAAMDDVYEQSVAGHRAILDACIAAEVPRLVCVGGAASLRTPEGMEYIDSPHWDPEFDPYRNAILGTRALYYLLKPEQAPDWVFVAPSAWLRPGERTGIYRIGGDDMLFGSDGTSRISLEDYAKALVDEVVAPAHHRERFTVGY